LNAHLEHRKAVAAARRPAIVAQIRRRLDKWNRLPVEAAREIGRTCGLSRQTVTMIAHEARLADELPAVLLPTRATARPDPDRREHRPRRPPLPDGPARHLRPPRDWREQVRRWVREWREGRALEGYLRECRGVDDDEID
jgi:hypothetical protein